MAPMHTFSFFYLIGMLPVTTPDRKGNSESIFRFKVSYSSVFFCME